MAKKVKNPKETTDTTENKEGIEILEDPEALQEQFSKSQEFATKNKNAIMGLLTVVVVVIAAVFFYQMYVGQRSNEAHTQLFPAVFYFEKDSLDQALQGDGNSTDGFLAIAEEFGMTDAGNLANFYAGASYLKKGEYQQAITFLGKFSSSDLLVQARAFALTGDAYFEMEDYGNAASFYQKAADHEDNSQFSPMYLMKLALVHEAQGNIDAAKSTYQKIIDDYSTANTEVNEAKKYLSKLEMASN